LPVWLGGSGPARTGVWEEIRALLPKPNWAHGGLGKWRKVPRVFNLPHSRWFMPHKLEWDYYE
jgi:hypothetical protein